jgi:Phosphotransferase enzyme family
VVPDWVAKRVAAERWDPIGGGYTRASKWRATLADGSTAFVKAADDELGLRMAEVELLVYRGVSGSFLPRVLDAWAEDGRALLVLEDLSSAHWPPPYPEETAPLFFALDELAVATPPADLRRLPDRNLTRWEDMRNLDVCSPRWLDAAIGPLEEAERSFSATGDELVHYDVWSANLCFAQRGVVFVDWAAARVGNRWVDVGYALLSVRAEGGTSPALEIPNEAGLAAYIAGSVVREVTAPLPNWAQPGSTLREDQRGDLVHALRWVGEALGLEAER